jgi:hypothetical protein
MRSSSAFLPDSTMNNQPSSARPPTYHDVERLVAEYRERIVNLEAHGLPTDGDGAPWDVLDDMLADIKRQQAVIHRQDPSVVCARRSTAVAALYWVTSKGEARRQWATPGGASTFNAGRVATQSHTHFPCRRTCEAAEKLHGRCDNGVRIRVVSRDVRSREREEGKAGATRMCSVAVTAPKRSPQRRLKCSPLIRDRYGRACRR